MILSTPELWIIFVCVSTVGDYISEMMLHHPDTVKDTCSICINSKGERETRHFAHRAISRGIPSIGMRYATRHKGLTILNKEGRRRRYRRRHRHRRARYTRGRREDEDGEAEDPGLSQRSRFAPSSDARASGGSPCELNGRFRAELGRIYSPTGRCHCCECRVSLYVDTRVRVNYKDRKRERERERERKKKRKKKTEGPREGEREVHQMRVKWMVRQRKAKQC